MKKKVFITNKTGIFYSANTLKELFNGVEVEELFKEAFGFSLSRKHIDKYEKQYEANKNNPNNEFMQQL